MSKAKRLGFLTGYMQKKAFLGSLVGAAGNIAGEVLDRGVGGALAAPAALGIGGGLLASKITSPTGIDQKNLEKALLAAELEESLSEAKRQQLLALMRERRQGSKRNVREIHI